MMKFRYPEEYYKVSSYYGHKPLSSEQMVHEYEKMSRRVNKQLARIRESEFGTDRFYNQFYDRFPESAAGMSERNLAYALQDLTYFLQSERSSYTKARESRRKAVRSMKQVGFTFVTYNNYQDFANFMDLVKTAYGEHIYDSKRIVEYYDQHKSRDVTPEELFSDFARFQEAGGVLR